MTPYLAEFDVAMFALMIPILALMIPIVAILVSHQQKMAQIIHGSGGGVDARNQIEALRGEIAQLKQLVHQQAIQMDNLLSARRGSSSSEIGARIEQ